MTTAPSEIWRSKPARWAALLVCSMTMDWVLLTLQMPAALLIGPMVVGVAFGVGGSKLKGARIGLMAAQAVIGMLIARALSPGIIMSISGDWLEITAVVIVTVIASAFVGWMVTRMGTLPGTTGAWGSTPGAAAAMVAMAEAHGADPRLVAFMQYVRVLLVTATASSVSRMLLSWSGHALPPALPMAAEDPHFWPFIETMAVAGFGGWLGWRLKIPSGGLLIPMILGAAIEATGHLTITLPEWLLAVAYTGLGWYIGLGFTREVLMTAVRALPQLILATVLLILLCAASAWMLVAMLHTDPLTAYLATSPGGLDTVTIIAVGSQSNIPLVLATQTLRVFVVVLTGPRIAKWISRHAPPLQRVPIMGE